MQFYIPPFMVRRVLAQLIKHLEIILFKYNLQIRPSNKDYSFQYLIKEKKLERANCGITNKFFMNLMRANFAQLYMLNETKKTISHVIFETFEKQEISNFSFSYN